jgi:D-alanine-D-alanine ligase
MPEKLTIAVFFGGRSPEHDVSIITGLQAIQAIDPSKFTVLPVYVATDGQWWTGAPLLDRKNYIPSDAVRATLTNVTLSIPGHGQRGALTSAAKGLFSKAKDIPFDVALLAFHGNEGEDGHFQALLEMASIPYTGMRYLASAVFMDKIITKDVLARRGVPVLPSWTVTRPASGLIPDLETVTQATVAATYPLIVKPAHLGSSIGVARVTNFDDLYAVLPSILRMDDTVLIEPCVENLEEYNIAVCGFGGDIRTSAIERPKRTEALLDFKQKYMTGGGKSGGKGPAESSQGMLSLTRDINPVLPPDLEAKIRNYATVAFRCLAPCGAPRIDFLYNTATGELWLNEINPCPGSFGYFLWEAAARPLLFSDLLDNLVSEAVGRRGISLGDDPTPPEARLFKR